MSSDDEQAELAQLRAQRNARTGVSSVVRSLHNSETVDTSSAPGPRASLTVL